MLDLKEWREKWEAMEREEDRIYRNPTIEESVRLYLALCHAAAPMIEEAKHLFLDEREAFLTELQSRIRKFQFNQNEIAAESS
jgi:hypothetical protein